MGCFEHPLGRLIWSLKPLQKKIVIFLRLDGIYLLHATALMGISATPKDAGVAQG